MLWAILILALAVAAAVLVAWQIGKSRAALARQVAQLGAEVSRRDHIIKQMEEVYREAAGRKDSMAAGTDAERLAASVEVLHSISGGGAKPAAGDVATVPGPGGKRGAGG